MNQEFENSVAQNSALLKPVKTKLTRSEVEFALKSAEEAYNSGGRTSSQALTYTDALMKRAQFGSKDEKSEYENRAISVLEEAINKGSSLDTKPVEQVFHYNLKQKLILAYQASNKFEQAYEAAQKLANDPFVTRDSGRQLMAKALIMTSVVGIKDGSQAEKIFDSTFKEIDVVPKDATPKELLNHYKFMKKVVDDSADNVKWSKHPGRRLGYFFGITVKLDMIDRAILSAEREVKKLEKLKTN